MTSVRAFIKAYTKELAEENAAIFAGAGLSMASGFLSWRDLLRDIAEELELNIDKEHDLVAIAQFHFNNNQSRAQINQQIIEKFTANARQSEVHSILARLPIRTFWTTNYDTLIEDGLRAANKKVDKKIDQRSLSINVPGRDAVVYKMHGDVLVPSDAVITKDDYETYNEKRQLFTTALQGDLVSKTFLFIGFSFEDPNLGYILSRIRILLGANNRTHYAFFKKLDKSDFPDPEALAYANVKMRHHLEDLKRYSISAVIVDAYSDIPKILTEIEQSINQKNIFISGSAHDYGEWSPEQAHELINLLCNQLVRGSFKITSGFGLGIGSFVINSAVQAIHKMQNGHIGEFLRINPFPFQLAFDEKTRFNRTYRDALLSQCGVAIFIFGNKLVEGKLVIGDGVLEEFRIAVDRGLRVIPVGSTGFAANAIFEQVVENIGNFPYLENYYQTLGQSKDPKQIVEAILQIMGDIPGGP